MKLSGLKVPQIPPVKAPKLEEVHGDQAGRSKGRGIRLTLANNRYTQHMSVKQAEAMVKKLTKLIFIIKVREVHES